MKHLRSYRRLGKQPTARAQILYNTGRVAQARNDLAGARRAYAESLSLRNNAVQWDSFSLAASVMSNPAPRRPPR